MDNEKELRAELMAALDPGFRCWEHVPVRHPIFTNRELVADVVVVPRDPSFAGLTLAFEVKDPLALSGPKKHLDVPYWTRAIHQASGYIYATVGESFPVELLQRRRISSAFIFPTTCLRQDPQALDHCNREYLNRIHGAFEVGVHSRVGKAQWRPSGGIEQGRLDLWLGNNVWRSDLGFRNDANTILRGRRPIGSQQADIIHELAGTDVENYREPHRTS